MHHGYTGDLRTEKKVSGKEEAATTESYRLGGG